MSGEAADPSAAERDNREFQLAIATITGNAIIVSMVEALQAQSSASPMWRKLKDHIHAEGNQPLWIEDHYGMAAALRRGTRTRPASRWRGI